MKKTLIIAVTLGIMFSLAGMNSAWANDEKNLDKQVSEVNKTGDTADGGKVVAQKIEKQFSVSADQVKALRDQKLGYGEISVVYSLASKMDGGITDANVQKIMTMRQGPPTMGWGKIAKELGYKLGPVVSSVKNVNAETRREMHKEKKEGRADRQEGQGRMEKHERSGGAERAHGR